MIHWSRKMLLEKNLTSRWRNNRRKQNFNLLTKCLVILFWKLKRFCLYRAIVAWQNFPRNCISKISLKIFTIFFNSPFDRFIHFDKPLLGLPLIGFDIRVVQRRIEQNNWKTDDVTRIRIGKYIWIALCVPEKIP